MKNLFKTQEQLITELHNEIDSAQERLLNEAKAIINSANLRDEDALADKHLKLGFVNSEIVKTISDKRDLVKISREQAELIERYKQKYPFQKFITVEDFESICKKYNLIFASIDRYKKNVPMKNLLEIESAPELKGKDKEVDMVLFKCW
jgi:hypothetical protein